MTRDRWSVISRIYHEASARPADDRDQFVRDASAGDADVERQVRSLLANSSDDSFLRTAVPLDWRDGQFTPPIERVGPFEVRGLLGFGGMGEVYRAHDASLGRDVAIKILPRQFIADRDRMARFEREARVLATLNHPNIAAIYGVEVVPPEPDAAGSGLRAMVLELVEGETLAERLQRGAVPLSEALAIARQVIDALDAAHEKGIVHRDLKPANIKIRPDAVVKVLDFGLSKALDVASAPEERSVTPATGHTAEGLVLGTPAYMSPEQARGQSVDKRTDVWAFGCVLYEMLAGVAPFHGDTVSDTISAILTREPDLSALPRATPLHVRRLIERCLVKDARRRLRDIADAGADLDERSVVFALPPRSSVLSRRVLAALAVVLLVAAASWFAAARFAQRDSSELRETGVLERLTYDTGLTSMPAVSPDGQLIAYSSDRGGRGDLDIWVQQTGGGPPLRLTTDPADDHWPQFAPDGKQIVFRSERGGGGVYVVPALGGPERLVIAAGRNPRFSPDGTQLAYWAGQFRGPASEHASALFTIPLAGGAPHRIASGFEVARDPVWAPDGRSLVFLGRGDRQRPVAETFDWWWAPLDGRSPVKTGMFESGLLKETIAFQGEGSPAAWTAEGVLFTAESNLWLVPLSVENGRPTAPPKRLTTVTGRAEAPSIDRDGSVVFAVTQSQRVIERVSVDPQQAEPKPLVVYTDNRTVALRAGTSADGATMVFDQGFQNYREIWIRDTRTGRQHMLVRVMAEFPGSPTISSDGARVVYRVGDAGGADDSQAFVVELAGGVPKPLCDRCGVYGFLSDNFRALAVWNERQVIGTIDVRNGARVELIRAQTGRIDRPHASPDDGLLAFRHTIGSTAKIYVAPLPAGRVAPPAEWQLVEQPTTTGRPAGWSLDSAILYSLLDTDGFRCIWAQRIDRRTGRLAGPVFAVRHLHMQMENSPSTSFSNPVTVDGMLYERISRTGDLWRLRRVPDSKAY